MPSPFTTVDARTRAACKMLPFAGTLNPLTKSAVLPELAWKTPANPPCPAIVNVVETAPAMLLVAVVIVLQAAFGSANGQNWMA